MKKEATSLRSVLVGIGVAAAAVAASLPVQAETSILTVDSDPGAQHRVRSIRRQSADDERFVAAANETVDIVFSDGTSLTLASGASLVVERYRYDRTSRMGELELRVDAGTVRVMGGVLNNTNAINVKLPGGSARLENAATYLEVGSERTRVSLFSPGTISMSGTGNPTVLATPGVQAELGRDGAVGPVVVSQREEARRLALATNPGLATGVAPTFVVENAIAQPVLAAAGTGEDSAAKEVVPVPDLGSSVIVANCGSGCAAGRGLLTLSESVASIGNRQAGRTIGAQWASLAEQPNADSALLTDADTRNTVGRIFAVNPANQFEVSLSETSVQEVSTYQELACWSSAGDCGQVSIVNLLGAGYRLAAPRSAPGLTALQVAFLTDPNGGFSIVSTPYPLLLDNIVDLHKDKDSGLPSPTLFEQDAGRVQVITIDREVKGDCRDFSSGGGCQVDGGSSEEALASAMKSLGDGRFVGNGVSLFAELVGVDVEDGGGEEGGVEDGGGTYNVHLSFNENYERRSLHTGFHLGRPEPDLEDGDGGDSGDLDDENSAPLTLTVDPDSFLAVDLRSPTQSGSTRSVFFATGSVSGPRVTEGRTLDVFNITAGLPSDSPGELPSRAFLRTQSLSDVQMSYSDLVDSRLLVLNQGDPVETPSRAFHYDFGVKQRPNGEQVSTISVTLGRLRYVPEETAAQLLGRTVGSISGGGSGLMSVQSPVLSTAVGGGNPHFSSAQGRAHYLVLENYDPVNAPLGGAERSVGGSSGARYASLRVGALTGTSDLQAGASGDFSSYTPGALAGFASGLIDQSHNRVSILRSEADGVGKVQPNFLLSLDADAQAPSMPAGSVGAALLGIPGGSLVFGSSATDGAADVLDLSAYTAPKEFAAMTLATPAVGTRGELSEYAGTNAAIISGVPLIGQGGDRAGWNGMSEPLANTMKSYKHLQWGFFLGDVQLQENDQFHAHMVSWVAGKVSTEGLPASGVFSYQGHVLANIRNGDSVYSSTGTFSNQWNFANRSGTGSMTLDDRSYSLQTRVQGLDQAVAGGNRLAAEGPYLEGRILEQGEVVGSLQGAFMGGANGAAPQALGGQFSVSREAGDYIAVGTFAAER